MSPGALLCVGGPLNGQMRDVPAGGRSLIISTAPESWLIDASMASYKVPEATVTVNRAVYKVEPLGYQSPGVNLRIKVLAYYGTARSDRPEGFYL